MSEAIEKAITDDQRIALLMAISKADGLPQKLPAIADQLGVSIGDVVDLLNDPSFLKLVRGLTKAQASLTFHGEAVPRLIEIAQKGKDKQAMTAIQLLGKLTGDLTPHKIVDMRVTFDNLRSRSEATGDVDPLANLFEIKGDVIEAEVKEEVGDDYEEWEAGQ